MIFKPQLLLTLWFCATYVVNAQYVGAIEIDSSMVKPWLPKFELSYEGDYFFGEGESEAQLRLFFVDTLVVCQLISGHWEYDGVGEVWKYEYKNFKNVKIGEQGQFTSNKYTGQFVSYVWAEGNSEIQYGLRIDNPWYDWLEEGSYMIGTRFSATPKKRYDGKFTEASTKRLDRELLANYSKKDLRMLRNEVFARYGYIFSSGGDLDTYYRKQSWYHPQHTNVSNFLTDLENYNLELIKEVESEK